MMLGKRARYPFRRTASMTGINVDMEDPAAAALPEPQAMITGGHCYHDYDHRQSQKAILSPRYVNAAGAGEHRLETANFLRTCGLCNRRLAPGRDIYMYRGDTAFCSQECREQQMKQDEMAASEVSKNGKSHHNHSPPPDPTSPASPSGWRPRGSDLAVHN